MLASEGWIGIQTARIRSKTRSVDHGNPPLHELVQHLQNVAMQPDPYAQARERVAYDAQTRWLGLLGRNLIDEFELDAMTLLVRTRCML